MAPIIMSTLKVTVQGAKVQDSENNPGASFPVLAFFDINMIAGPQAKAAVGP